MLGANILMVNNLTHTRFAFMELIGGIAAYSAPLAPLNVCFWSPLAFAE